MDIPDTKDALRDALIAQRQYTLGLYADLPERYWNPARFPFSPLTNPPLWELAHIAWFAEFFCCRWQQDDVDGLRTPSVWVDADALLNSSRVAQADRWILAYPVRRQVEQYMRDALNRVLDVLTASAQQRLPLFQLSLLHEDMHGEALLMTRRLLGLPLPALPFGNQTAVHASGALQFPAGYVMLGRCDRSFQFDNELPPKRVEVPAFEIDASPVTQTALNAWRASAGREIHGATHDKAIAMHMRYEEAAAFARDHGRRLPTEAEWEMAASQSVAFLNSTGVGWEWTSTTFGPREGFAAGPYHDYSLPWFPVEPVRVQEPSTQYMVLKGGSFATQPRLKYPQYRNFYTADRSDMFCAFRTCRSL